MRARWSGAGVGGASASAWRSSIRASSRVWSLAISSARTGQVGLDGGWTKRPRAGRASTRSSIRSTRGRRARTAGAVGGVEAAGLRGHPEELGSDALVDVVVEVDGDELDLGVADDGVADGLG